MREAIAEAYAAILLIALVIIAVSTYYILQKESAETIPVSTSLPSLSPSPSFSATPSPSPSLSTTPSPSPPPTLSPSATPTPSSTSTPTPTPPSSSTPTPTPTPAPTPTPTAPTATPTSTPLPSPSPSPSPSPNVTNALNWGGYVVASNVENPQPIVVGVSGSWVVPSVSTSRRATFSAVWIGIGGDFDKTLVQAGTEQDSIGGQTFYSAWYEILPDYVITIDDMNVSPGDQMNASIYLTDITTSQWHISIADLTTGQQYQNYTFYNSSQLSAEWIVERPEVNNRIGTLADFGSVTFTDCQVVLGSVTGVIGDFPYFVNVMYQNVSFGREVAPLVTVSSLDSIGSSFDVTYLGG